MRKIQYSFLALVILLGGFLRLYGLSRSPASLNWDEAAWGYNAYSISQLGRDEYGKFLPIFTRSFDEYKSTLPLYLMIPNIKVFGLNELSVRLPSALLGTLSIFLIFSLTSQIFKKNSIALVSAFVFAIEPWSVHLSRVYHDANEALFFLLLGLLLFLYSKSKPYLLIVAVLSFMISMYTYNANKVLVPLILAGLFFKHKKDLTKYPKVPLSLSACILAIFTSAFLFLALKGEALARVGSTNIFIFWPVTPFLNSLIEQHSANSIWSIFLHNKLFYFLGEVGGRYLAYFSPPNLFLREPQEPATILAGNSIFHSFEFIPWVVGLAYLFKNIQKYKELIFIVIVAPVPAMLTWNWFQPGRTMALFAVFSMLIGVGVVVIINAYSKITKKLGFFIFGIWGLLAAFYLFDSLHVYLPLRDSGNWQPGFRETVPVVMKYESKYSQVIIETGHGQPYIFYLFYGKYPPGRYLKELDLQKIGKPRKSFDFGKFTFRKIYWPNDRNLKNTLFVGSEENLPQKDIDNQKGAKVLEIVKNSRGDIQAKIVAIE